MFPKFYYKLLCFDKNVIGQIGVQGLNKYLNLPYKIGLIWGGGLFNFIEILLIWFYQSPMGSKVFRIHVHRYN